MMLLLLDVLLLKKLQKMELLPPQSWRSAEGCRAAAAGGAHERGGGVCVRGADHGHSQRADADPKLAVREQTEHGVALVVVVLLAVLVVAVERARFDRDSVVVAHVVIGGARGCGVRARRRVGAGAARCRLRKG